MVEYDKNNVDLAKMLFDYPVEKTVKLTTPRRFKLTI